MGRKKVNTYTFGWKLDERIADVCVRPTKTIVGIENNDFVVFLLFSLVEYKEHWPFVKQLWKVDMISFLKFLNEEMP